MPRPGGSSSTVRLLLWAASLSIATQQTRAQDTAATPATPAAPAPATSPTSTAPAASAPPVTYAEPPPPSEAQYPAYPDRANPYQLHRYRRDDVARGAYSHADPLGPQPWAAGPAEPWRGWQTLLVDLAGLSIGLGVAAGVDSEVSRLGLLVGTWYGIGVTAAPAIHYAHDRGGLGLGDFGLRALFPPLIGVVGLLGACIVHDEFDRSCRRDGMTGGLLLGLAGAAVFDALALSSLSSRPQSPAPERRYGWQILTIDAVAYALGVAFAMREPRAGHDRPHPALALWVSDYLIGSIGAPIVHFVHGRVGYGFASLGLRLIASPLGAVVGLIGGCSASVGGHDCANEGAIWGLFGGSVAVALFDALVLGREAEAATQASTGVSVALGAGSVGLQGRW